jgi:hypothetical protein
MIQHTVRYYASLAGATHQLTTDGYQDLDLDRV